MHHSPGCGTEEYQLLDLHTSAPYISLCPVLTLLQATIPQMTNTTNPTSNNRPTSSSQQTTKSLPRLLRLPWKHRHLQAPITARSQAATRKTWPRLARTTRTPPMRAIARKPAKNTRSSMRRRMMSSVVSLRSLTTLRALMIGPI